MIFLSVLSELCVPLSWCGRSVIVVLLVVRRKLFYGLSEFCVPSSWCGRSVIVVSS
jgi:hypothetical protein